MAKPALVTDRVYRPCGQIPRTGRAPTLLDAVLRVVFSSRFLISISPPAMLPAHASWTVPKDESRTWIEKRLAHMQVAHSSRRPTRNAISFCPPYLTLHPLNLFLDPRKRKTANPRWKRSGRIIAGIGPHVKDMMYNDYVAIGALTSFEASQNKGLRTCERHPRSGTALERVRVLEFSLCQIRKLGHRQRQGHGG